MAWKVDWRVLIDGADVSGFMRPYLTDISVSDKDGTASDSCSLTFDDTAGQIRLPRDGAAIIIFMDGVQVFEGKVDSIRSSGSRGGGRMLAVTGKGFDAKGKVKDGQRWHLDDSSLQDALGKAAQQAGLSGVVVDPGLASIMRDYWSPDGETFLGWGQRLARELGATFKIRGDRAVFAKRGAGLSAMGGAMPSIIGSVPGNVISWDIAPVTNRGRFSRASVRFFDRETATFKQKDVTIDSLAADAEETVLSLAADEGQAEGVAEARKGESEREGGEGSVELDLAPEAQAEGTFILAGARPGIDGSYRIVGVTHKANRSGGSTTSLDLKQPQGGAGVDAR